jgi:hypothetical protein
MLLEQLSQTLKQLQEQLAWYDLAGSETKPGKPPSFQTQTSAREHARREIPFLATKFKALALDLHDALHARKLPVQQREQTAHKLHELERTLNSLRLTERFISL